MNNILKYSILLLSAVSAYAAYGFTSLVLSNDQINISAQHNNDYINLKNIGSSAGTFIVSITDITDPEHPILHSPRDFKSLPIIVNPKVITNFRPHTIKRIGVVKNPKVELDKLKKYKLTLQEHKPPKAAEEVKPGEFAIEVKGGVVYNAFVTVE